MADNRTVKRNPWIVEMGAGRITKVPAAATTFKSGQFLTVSSGLATAYASDGTSIRYYSLTDQDTTLTAGDMVDVVAIADDTIFEGFVTTENGGHDIDSAITSANNGNAYGITVGTNYTTVNLSMTTASTSPASIVDYAPNYSPMTDTTSTSPGKCQFKIVASFLTVA